MTDDDRPQWLDPQKAYAEFLEAGNDWADTDAAASVLEETRKSLLSELKLSSSEKSDAAKETVALASATYQEHVRSMVEARRKANRARVRYDATKALVEMRRTSESTRRAELTMGSGFGT